MNRIKRRVKAVDTSNQGLLWAGNDLPAAPERPEAVPRPRVRFEAPDPKAIFINQVRLDEHLKRMDETRPFKVRALLDGMAFDTFEQAYPPGGRPPYAPRAMLGLILFGIMRGISSLRDLESLAKTDLGCWWVTGGIAPDHSIIGRFIQRHDERLTGEFFDGLTRRVLQVTGTNTQAVAGDGTIIEAAASRYGLMRQEALDQALAEARAAAPANSEEGKKDERVAQLEHAQEALQARQKERAAHGRKAETTLISPLEPDAVVQPQKDKKNFRGSYKPQVLANEARIIVACDVHPSSETAIVPTLLDQAGEQGEVETALFDAGYFSDGVIQACANREIELLCPEGRTEGEDWTKQSEKIFTKSRFAFDPGQDGYRCPNGQLLVPIYRYPGKEGAPAYVQYGTPACADCPLKSRCTTSETGRQIKRYAGDPAKEALRAKMDEPAVRLRYRKRQAMVEPVFSHLRGRQGLNRFRRRGLAAVRLEFALHAMAYNLSRAVALCPLIASLFRLARAVLRARTIHPTAFRPIVRFGIAHLSPI